MWLSRQMAAGSASGEGSVGGRVTAAAAGVTVQADGEYRSVEIYAPYGIAAVPRVGDEALLIEAGGEKHLLGVRCDTGSLAPGEIRIRSAGGAEILLKNSGEVLINGQCFAAETGEG